MQLCQDVQVHPARLAEGRESKPGILTGRSARLQVARGTLWQNGQVMNTGEGTCIQGEAAVPVLATSPTKCRYCDLA